MTTGPYVLAIDPKTTGASLAAIFRDDPKTPALHVARFGHSTEEFHTPAATFRRAQACAEKIVRVSVEKLGLGALPDLVIMSKQVPGNLRQDPSGPRRGAIWWETVRLWDDRAVPVGEFALMNIQSALAGWGSPGRDGFEATKREVLKLLPNAPRDKDGFFYPTLGLALAGAVVLGWKTPLPVTDKVLKGLRSQATSLPEPLRVPLSADDWKRYAAELNEGVGV